MILEIAAGLITLGIGWYTTGAIKKKWKPSMSYGKYPGYRYKHILHAACGMARYDSENPEGPKKDITAFLEKGGSPLFFDEGNWRDYFQQYQEEFYRKSKYKKKYALDSITELENVRAAKGAAIKEVEELNREVQ